MEYIIISDDTESSVIRQVNEKINDGYECVGGINETYSPQHGWWIAQAMIKRVVD